MYLAEVLIGKTKIVTEGATIDLALEYLAELAFLQVMGSQTQGASVLETVNNMDETRPDDIRWYSIAKAVAAAHVTAI